MLLYTTNQALLCKFFPTTLSGVTLNCYTSLPVGSIHTFAQLEAKFVSDFVASKRQEKSNFHLLSIQQEGESVATNLKIFQEAALEVIDLEDSVALNAMINGMRTPKLKFHLIKKQVRTYAEAMRHAKVMSLIPKYVMRMILRSESTIKGSKHQAMHKGFIERSPNTQR